MRSIVFVVLVCYSAARLSSSSSDELTICNTSADCPDGSCCVSRTRPRGKRQVLLGSEGTCHPVQQASDACFVNYGRFDERRVYYVNCPCDTGLTCKGNGIFDMPLGEMGTCSH